MTTIKLTDQFGLDIDVQPSPDFSLPKYLQQVAALRFDSLDLTKLGGLTLDQPALQSLSTGLTLQGPISLGDGGTTLSAGGGTHASIKLITRASDLPGNDDSMKAPADVCYVAFGIEATASASLSGSSGALQFGASPSSTLQVVSCTRFPLKTGITLLQAVEQTVACFCVPFHSSDLAGLPEGQVAQVTLTGKLELSGTANLLATVNPLASAALPSPLPTASVSAGGSVTIGASCQIQGDYQIVARKLDAGAIRLAWYRKDTTAVTVQAKVSEGVSAGFGTTDLFSQVVSAISADPKVDLKELASAGVSDDQTLEIQSAVKAAVGRKLEIAVAGQLSASDSRTAAFLFEIDPSAWTAESQSAVDQALRGNLSALHAPGLPGVSIVRSIWDKVRRCGMELDVNLLGILNCRSIATLSLAGKIMYEPATGSLVITDQATAERIRSTQVNFGADTQKLRHVLAESFLITAAYHGAKQFIGAASLHCSHSFFELQNATNRSDMIRKLQTGVALGLLSEDEAAPPAGSADFGRTLFDVSADYDENLVSMMFLDASGAPVARERYETAGRAAIQFLVRPGDDDAVRLQPATDDTLWSRMKEIGQPGFAALFPGVAAPLVGAITADYSAIQWWADAMHGTAQELAKVRRWLAQNPTATSDDSEFQKLRQNLAGYLRRVAANTREEFGQPWGVIAMNQLVNGKGGARFLIIGPTLVCNKRRELAAATGH
jgi:hypothetical protein